MKRFINSYSALAVVFFLLHLAGAFVIGATAPSRWDSSSGLSQASLPSPLAGGLDALAATGLLVALGCGLRFIAYRRLDADDVTNRFGWIVAAVAEAVYLGVNLWLVFGATTPQVDAGFVWLFAAYVGFIVTLFSAALLIAVSLALRRRTSRAAQAPEPQPAP